MNKKQLQAELSFKAVRSSGAGGQNVNKVATKVQLSWPIASTAALSPQEQERAISQLTNRINKEGILVLECDASRSQIKNKELVVQRLFLMLENALVEVNKRVPTKIPKSVLRKRLHDKKLLAEKKQNRRLPRF